MKLQNESNRKSSGFTPRRPGQGKQSRSKAEQQVEAAQPTEDGELPNSDESGELPPSDTVPAGLILSDRQVVTGFMKQGANTAALAVKAFYTGMHLAIPGVDVSTLFVDPEENPSEDQLLRDCAIEVFGEQISDDKFLLNSPAFNEYLLPADSNSSPDSNPASEPDPTSPSADHSEHFESSQP